MSRREEIEAVWAAGADLSMSAIDYLLRVARAAEEAHRLLALAMDTRPADWIGVSMARADLHSALEDNL